MPTDSLDLVQAYYLITKCLLPFLLYVMYVMQWIALMSVLVELCIFSGWFRWVLLMSHYHFYYQQ